MRGLKEAGPETKVRARGRLGRPLQADTAMANTPRTVGKPQRVSERVGV